MHEAGCCETTLVVSSSFFIFILTGVLRQTAEGMTEYIMKQPWIKVGMKTVSSSSFVCVRQIHIQKKGNGKFGTIVFKSADTVILFCDIPD